MTESRPPVAKPPRQTSKLPTEDQKSAAAALEKSIPVLKKERKPKRPRTTAAEGGEGADADVDGGKERKKAKKSVKKQGLADSEAVKARTKEAIREEEARIAAEGGPKELTKKEQRRRRKQEKERLEGGKKEVEVEAKVQPKPLVLPKGALPVHKDESLSVQAQKALAYAQTINTAHFKFMKARQNWLMKHCFDEEEIPEKYLSITLNYLKTIQGGSRKSLVTSSRSILHPPSASAVAAAPAEAASLDPNAPKSILKPSTSDTTAAKDDGEAEVKGDVEEESEEEKADAEKRKARAREVLSALGESEEAEEEENKESEMKDQEGIDA